MELTTLKNTGYPPFAVVELFTSQGCSSCPPADDILRGYADAENVYPLSFHVTYWNRLGWQDVYSQKEFDERQYMYGNHFNLRSVYTPQTVVNGAFETVGSRKGEVKNAIAEALKKPALASIVLNLNKKKNEYEVSYKLSGEYKNSLLNLLIVEKSIKTEVLRGENEGRTLYHDNVVRLFKTIEMGDSTEGVSVLNIDDNWVLGNCKVIAFLQDRDTLKVKAATGIR
jgi:hypothetical protein